MAKISDSDVAYLLSLKDDDITKDLLIDLFAYGKTKKPRFQPNDTFTLPKDRMGNKEPIPTTVGRYIFNLFIIAPHFLPHIGYQNKPVTGGFLNKMEDDLSEYLLDRTIPAESFIDYLNRIQWLGYVMNDFLCPSMSFETIKADKSVLKKRDELVKQNKEELNRGTNHSAIVAAQIEEQLVKQAKDNLKGDPTMDLYDSGAKTKFGNQYKATNVMKGAIRDNATGGYNVATTSYVEGIRKEDYAAFGDTIVFAAYSRAVGTQKGGYETKKMFAAFQTVTLDEPGSDCRTKKTLTFTMDKSNYRLFLFRYIIENGKMVQLTNSNIESYIGKVVHLRSTLYCQSEKLCSKCAGELYYKLGIMNIGLTATRLSSSLLNLSLKNFHDTTINLSRIDVNKYID